MSKDWKPNKQTVELEKPEQPARPSRIRREPVQINVPADLVSSSAWWRSEEWEVPIAIVGMIIFALGINAMWFVFTQLFG